MEIFSVPQRTNLVGSLVLLGEDGRWLSMKHWYSSFGDYILQGALNCVLTVFFLNPFITHELPDGSELFDY